MIHFSHQFIFQGNLIWSHIYVSQIHLVLPTFLHFNHIFLSISWSDHKNPSLVIFQKQTLSFLGKYSLSFNGTDVFPVLKFRILGTSMIPLWLTGCQHPHACMLGCFSPFRLLATLWTVALQAALSMGFSWQEYWSGLPCPPPGDLSDPRIKPLSLKSLAYAGGFFTTSATYKARQRLQIHLYSTTLTFPFFYSLDLYSDPYCMILTFRLLPSWSVFPTIATIIFSKCILFSVQNTLSVPSLS